MDISQRGASPLVSEEDLEALPEELFGEILDGELIVHPRPDAPHTEAASALGALLIWEFRRSAPAADGWVILHEPGIRLGPSLLVPDLAGWRRDRFVSPEKGPYLVAPDWVCEVLSPSTARDDRVRKLPIYARHGVRHTWVVDPAVQTLEVLRLCEAWWLLAGAHGGSEQVRAEPFETLEIDLSQLWGDRSTHPEPAGWIAEPAAETR